MRILHIDPDDMDNPYSGGGPVRTFEICRRLVARAHEVTVLTPTFEGSTPERVRDGVRYVRLGRRIGSHLSSHHITFFFAAARALGSFEHDLLVEDFMPPMGPTFTPLRSRRPVVGSVQWFSARELQRRFHLPFVWGERRLTRHYRHLVVLTDRMREHLQAHAPQTRFAVIPNGVDERFFRATPTFGEYILYVGRIDSLEKGVDQLLAAYARLDPASRPELLLAGHGPETGAMQALAQRLGIDGGLRWLGVQTPAVVAQLLAGCRFACVPSRVETFGMTLLEAQAAGKPAICFDRWPMNEVAHPAACVRVPAADTAAFAAAMNELWQRPVRELEAMGAQGRAWAGRFTWDAAADAQERFYREALEAAA